MAVIHEQQSNGVRVPNRGNFPAECRFDGQVVHIVVGTCDVQLSPAELTDAVRAVRSGGDRSSSLSEEVRKSQTFEAIGAFVFQFSQLEFTIQHLLSRALNLSEEQVDAVISPYDFARLCTVTQTILAQKLPSQKTRIDDLFGKCQGLNTERVRVAHGMWADDGRTLAARHVSRSSSSASHYFADVDALEKLTEKAGRLMADLLDMMRRPGS